MANPVLQGGGSTKQSVYETSTTQEHPIGTRGVLDDRSFRYARITSGTAIGTNKLAQMPIQVAGHVAETGALTGTTAVGSTRITASVGATDMHANMYADGYFKIQSATTGAGTIYKVKEHGALVYATSPVLTLDLYDPINVATSGTTTWSLIQNPYADVIIMPTTVTAPPAGVPLVTFPAASTTAPVFGWLQTWGVCSVLNGTDNLLINSLLIPWNTTTAGAVGIRVDATAATMIAGGVGFSLETITTDDIYASVFLTLAP